MVYSQYKIKFCGNLYQDVRNVGCESNLFILSLFTMVFYLMKRLSNNSKTEEKEGQIGLQIQKEAIFLVPKAIARQPLSKKLGVFCFQQF